MSNQADTSVLRGRSRMNTHAQVTLTGGDYTVPITYCQYGTIEFTGNVGSTNFKLILPPVDGHIWLIFNNTTGSGTMTVVTSAPGSTGPVVSQGTLTPVWEDGTNVSAWAAGALGSISSTTAISAGLQPLPPAGYGVSDTSNPGAGYMTLEVPVGTTATWNLAPDVNAWTTAITFTGASQDFTANFPLSGTHPWWFVWNDTDYTATFAPPSGTASAVNSTLPPRSAAVLAMVTEMGGTVAAKLYGTTAPYTGASSVTVPNAATYTLTIAQAANPSIKFTGGNQPATITFPAGETLAGREWTLWNNTSFLLHLKGNSGDAFGLDLPSGCFARVSLDATLRIYATAPIVVHDQHGFVEPTGAAGLSVNSDTPTFTWGIIQNFNLEVGGTRSVTITATWETGTGMTAGQAWIVKNGTNQVLVCKASGGTNTITLQIGDRRFIYFDGTDLRPVPDGYIQGASGNGANQNGSNLVVAGGQSTGFGTGGELHLQIGSTGSSGSTLNALYDKLVLVDNLGTFLQLHAGTGDVFRIQTVEAATSGSQLKSLPGIYYRGQYWNGSTSVAVDVGTDLNVSSTAPNYQYRIVTAGIPRVKVGENGQFILAGTHVPADAELLHSEAALYLDDTDGTSALWIKQKSLGSNVVSTPVGGSSVCGITLKTGIAGASPTVVLTENEAAQGIISLQGTATGTPVIQVPNGVRRFIVNNQIAVGVSVKTSGGSAATVSASTNRWVFIDSNNNANAV